MKSLADLKTGETKMKKIKIYLTETDDGKKQITDSKPDYIIDTITVDLPDNVDQVYCNDHTYRYIVTLDRSKLGVSSAVDNKFYYGLTCKKELSSDKTQIKYRPLLWLNEDNDLSGLTYFPEILKRIPKCIGLKSDAKFIK